jgi:primosomal protein DnaI
MADGLFSNEPAMRGQVNLSDALKSYMDRHQLHEEYDKIKAEVLADPEIVAFLTAHQDELTPAIVNRDFAVLYEYWNQAHRTASGETVVHKGYKPSLGIADQRLVVMYQPDETTVAAQRLQAQAEMVQAIGMPKLIKRASLEDYDLSNPGRQQAYTMVIKFMTAYLADPNAYHRGFYLHGAYGIGKTYLMGAMANALALQGVPVTLIHFPSLAIEMRNAIGAKENVQDKLQTIKQVPILVVDDIGAESLSAWIRDDVLGVIMEYRMQNELPTFFTSNFSMDQLEKEHLAVTKDGVEPVKAERLMQRIKYLAKEVSMTGENRRTVD